MDISKRIVDNIIFLILADECSRFISYLERIYTLYINFGSRSSKKVDYFHKVLKTELEKIFLYPIYEIKLEENISSINSNNKKRCDIIIYKNKYPYIVIPTKVIMSNYKQNKNNSWENLTGELMHIKWANKNIHIIPINIFMNLTPYLNENKIIKKFEIITYDDIINYKMLMKHNIAYDMINYIIDVKHNCEIGEKFCKLPTILNFNENTKYRNLNDIFKDLV